MACCEEILTPFINESETTVPYSGEFGDEPNVEVMYEIDGVWQQGVFSGVRFTGTSVIVDHGGAATGVIKLS